MHPLPAAGIPWGHQLMSLLMGDLKTGISSHHIPSAGSRRGFLGDALTTHPTPATLTGRFWDPQNSKSLSLGSPGSPITKMVAVAGKLWCGCQNRVIVLNTATLAQEVRAGDGGRSGGR